MNEIDQIEERESYERNWVPFMKEIGQTEEKEAYERHRRLPSRYLGERRGRALRYPWRAE